MLLYHPNTTDIAMEVIKSFYVKENKKWKIKVMWWNIGKCHQPWCMNIVERLVLTDEQYRQWKPKVRHAPPSNPETNS